MKPPRFRAAPPAPSGAGDVTISDLAAALASARVGLLDVASRIVVRLGASDRYVAAWTTENDRLVLCTSTVDMWRNESERSELVERIIRQESDLNMLRAENRRLTRIIERGNAA